MIFVSCPRVLVSLGKRGGGGSGTIVGLYSTMSHRFVLVPSERLIKIRSSSSVSTKMNSVCLFLFHSGAIFDLGLKAVVNISI